ncbi:MAG: hypothetical protein ACREVA_03545 [Burkholderiales bacterium]
MQNGQPQMDPVQQNMYARQMLLQTAIPIKKRVGRFTGFALGSTAKIRLLNTGLTVGLKALVSITMDLTATPPQSIFSLFPLVQRVTLTDYNQIDRVDTDAFSLMVANSRRRDELLDARVTPFYTGAVFNSEVYAFPTTGAAQVALLWIDIPFSVDPSHGDLRGVSLSQSVVGEQFVSFRFCDTLVNADPTQAPYASGTVVITAGTTIGVELWQEYLQPQNMQSLPLIDLSTIYEIKGLFRTTSDIGTNGQKLINYPNVRTVLSASHLLIANNLPPTGTVLSTLQLLANSSQILNENSYASKQREQMNRFNSHVSQALLDFDHRASPISTAIFGNIQLALNFGTVPGGNTFVQSQFESLYASGSPLPGISTQ